MEIENDGLLAAWLVSSEGDAETIGWQHLDDEVEGGAWRWIHLHRDGHGTQSWLLDGTIPPNQIAWALMADDTRPRYTEIEGTGLLFLRGVNLNKDAEPEDMISLRMSIDPRTVITVAVRRLRTIDDLMEDFAEGDIPPTPGAFIERIVHYLRERAEPVVDELEEIIAQHELDAITDKGVPSVETRNAFTDARQDAVILRRYLVPQAEALRTILRHEPPWIESREVLEEEAAAHDRIVEDLDTVRERAAVLRDEMGARLAERMNEIMLALSIVSVVFLPITFVTGLFGMNVAGLPLSEVPWGFWAVCGFMALCTGLTAFMLWRMLRR